MAARKDIFLRTPAYVRYYARGGYQWARDNPHRMANLPDPVPGCPPFMHTPTYIFDEPTLEPFSWEGPGDTWLPPTGDGDSKHTTARTSSGTSRARPSSTSSSSTGVCRSTSSSTPSSNRTQPGVETSASRPSGFGDPTTPTDAHSQSQHGSTTWTGEWGQYFVPPTSRGQGRQRPHAEPRRRRWRRH